MRSRPFRCCQTVPSSAYSLEGNGTDPWKMPLGGSGDGVYFNRRGEARVGLA